ncbi:hypothetical protein QFZ66_007694 [Streptomyces sp. B4I13]|uniref:hypothetical protein n=1 Tax=Streptomyces sp. B4I13 TaxID=3042271 RepID=UPI002784B0C0|nr:hypothetical protein [Streptomyces sp. B4I13]
MAGHGRGAATSHSAGPASLTGYSTPSSSSELVEPGELPPDAIHLPGVFVQRALALTAATATATATRLHTVA